ncbi:radical SAM protein [Sedimentibacter sp. zth1]|uniref:radical SAM/SPASM domain-containing protein n=1 Tax=Sedimentibacter sp. zth1 TaxID=2816908 RepID=UPI001A91296C|nr:radical SAM protein [Sedimentibacter sp. zth1]QSX05398.1 radical SAM protein [Sedimentibacter sp. zth1]
MYDTLQCKLNPNIQIKKLRNGKSYLLVNNYGEDIYPIFLKDNVIKFISSITTNEYVNNKENRYTDLINILYNQNILVDEFNNQNKVKYKSEKDITKLRVLALETRTPLYAKFEITYTCNYKCKYCFISGSKNKVLRYKEIEKVLYELSLSGINELYLTGGEPFTHPDILKIIDYCSKLNFKVIIQTNGFYITEEIAKILSSYKNISISISFHSVDENQFDNFTDTVGSYRKTLESIKILKKYNVDLLCKCCVTCENENNIKDTIHYFEENDIKFSLFTQILPNVNNELSTREYCMNNETISWLYENNYLKFIKSVCSAFKDKFWVSPLGEIYPCELFRHSVGNLLNSSFKEIWENEESLKFVIDKLYSNEEKCIDCQYSKWCNKCLAYKYFDNWTGYLEQFCQKAMTVKKLYS